MAPSRFVFLAWSCGVAPRPAHLRAAPFVAFGRATRSHAVVLSDATASEESEKVVLARLETQIKMKELQLKMVQMLVCTAVASVALVALGIIVAQSASANAWLQKLVSDPIKASFATLVSFVAVFLAPFAAWLQGLFKENRESIEQNGKELKAELKADRKESAARVDQSNARVDRTYASFISLLEERNLRNSEGGR